MDLVPQLDARSCGPGSGNLPLKERSPSRLGDERKELIRLVQESVAGCASCGRARLKYTCAGYLWYPSARMGLGEHLILALAPC